jgi:hypothetical protein
MAPRFLLDDTWFTPLSENQNVLPHHRRISLLRLGSDREAVGSRVAGVDFRTAGQNDRDDYPWIAYNSVYQVPARGGGVYYDRREYGGGPSRQRNGLDRILREGHRSGRNRANLGVGAE